MDGLALSRWQFAVTTVYHFFFVPLTLGLSLFVAFLETLYVRTGDETYKRMTKFWGKLFLINFALGVATGIVQEFQFGMNWSEYSRFVGDIFGAPLAIEALMAFFLESTFLGIWIFGWDKLPKALHAATIWLVALGSNLSALWILIANSFMHEPVGYTIAASGRAEMTDFWALLGNPHVWYQFPHVFFAGATTASFFVLGVSAYHLVKHAKAQQGDAAPAAASKAKAAGKTKGKRPARKAAAPAVELFRRSFAFAVVGALLASTGAGLVGHFQGARIFKIQPMKGAASEGIYETEDPADLALIAFFDEEAQREVWALKIPKLASFLVYNRFSGEIRGLNELQAEYEAKYGPGNYIPPVTLDFWAFRTMVGAGSLMGLIGLVGLYLLWRKKQWRLFTHALPFAIVLPYLANSAGWILTETGRQPWIVYGLMKTEEGVSTAVPAGTMLFSLLAFMVLYGVLIVADVYLLAKYARQEADGGY